MHVRTLIVGGRHHPGALTRSLTLEVGERVLLVREPSNPYDKHAVAVMTAEGVKLGYVPRQDAPLIAKAIDAGLDPVATCRAKASTSIAITWEN